MTFGRERSMRWAMAQPGASKMTEAQLRDLAQVHYEDVMAPMRESRAIIQQCKREGDDE